MIAFVERPSTVTVPWPEVERALGRPYEQTYEDAVIIRTALLLTPGVPEWVNGCGGYLDKLGMVFTRF